MSERRRRRVAGVGLGYHERLRALGPVLPLLIFLGVTFLAPLGTMLLRSVYNPGTWHAIRAAGERFTAHHYLNRWTCGGCREGSGVGVKCRF